MKDFGKVVDEALWKKMELKIFWKLGIKTLWNLVKKHFRKLGE